MINRLTPLELSHGLAFILGGLFTLIGREFGFLPWGILAGLVALGIRCMVEYHATRAHRRVVLDQWFGDES